MQQRGIRERLPIAAGLLVAGYGGRGVSRHHGGGVAPAVESMIAGLPICWRDSLGWSVRGRGGFIHLLGNPA